MPHSLPSSLHIHTFLIPLAVLELLMRQACQEFAAGFPALAAEPIPAQPAAPQGMPSRACECSKKLVAHHRHCRRLPVRRGTGLLALHSGACQASPPRPAVLAGHGCAAGGCCQLGCLQDRAAESGGAALLQLLPKTGPLWQQGAQLQQGCSSSGSPSGCEQGWCAQNER